MPPFQSEFLISPSELLPGVDITPKQPHHSPICQIIAESVKKLSGDQGKRKQCTSTYLYPSTNSMSESVNKLFGDQGN